ncbi:putative membrane protein [Asticcacaulis biprosthecium C19]|uniref:Putative membrane protein n=1 Tax=Asticcacaulis biprosthecium C19 TaxID=715226 RepID=F4QII8_9CAUL|nr:putative membrane protein [Asticcacaulis biprosthecium C19]
MAWAATFFSQSRDGNGPGIWVFVIDSLMMLAFIVLSAVTRKIWTLFAAAFAMAAVLCHIAGMIGQVNVVTYVTGIMLWGAYGMLVALTGGMISVELERYRRHRQKPES